MGSSQSCYKEINYNSIMGGFGVGLVVMGEIRFVCNTKNVQTLRFPLDPILASLSKQQQSFCLAKKKALLKAG